MSIRPDYYTSHEGGDWISFPRSFTEHNIPELSRRHETQVIISGLRVHSLAFGNPKAGEGYYLRWDCISGFTQRPPLAKFNPEENDNDNSA